MLYAALTLVCVSAASVNVAPLEDVVGTRLTQ